MLAERDKFAFQQWVCDQIGIEADVQKGADKGIDGELVRYDLQGRVWKAVVWSRWGLKCNAGPRPMRNSYTGESRRRNLHNP